MPILLLKKDSDISWPSKWFSIAEVRKASQMGTFVMNEKLAETLKGCDLLREEIGQPILITNGCRFNGSETSQHYFKQFNALDIWTSGYNSIELMEVVERLDIFTGRGLYPYDHGFIHVDCREGLQGNVVRWYRDKNGEYHVVRSFNKFYKEAG